MQVEEKPEKYELMEAGFLQTPHKQLFENENEHLPQIAQFAKNCDSLIFKEVSIDRFFDTNTDISAAKLIINPEDT